MNLHRIARILLDPGLSHNAAAGATCLHRATVAKYRARLRTAAIDVAQLDSLTEAQLQSLMVASEKLMQLRKNEPDWSVYAVRPSEPDTYVTDLHEEYSAETDHPLSYETFKRRIKDALKARGPIMRIPRVPGEEGFVDFAGKPPSLVKPETGKKEPVELFVATLGHSRLTFAYAVLDQTVTSWLSAHVEMFRYWGGVPKYIVPDNLKAAVIRARGSQRGFLANRSYAILSDHYRFTILPARRQRPKDKGSVEAGVKLAKRWIVLPLRDQVFTSLAELNEKIAVLLERLNDRPMRGMGGKSRRQIFTEEEKDKLQRLPAMPFSELEHARSAKVPRDYHIEFKGNFYSVPCDLIGETVDLMIERDCISIFHRHKRIAMHPVLRGKGQRSTIPAHMTAAHAAYANQRHEHSHTWGSRQALPIRAYLKAHRQLWKNPHATSKASMKLQRLVELYGEDIVLHATPWLTSRSPDQLQIGRVEMLIRRPELMQRPSDEPDDEPPPIKHDNIRGADYYRGAGE